MKELVGDVLFVITIGALIYIILATVRSVISYSFKRELRWKLENARRRREARRRSW